MVTDLQITAENTLLTSLGATEQLQATARDATGAVVPASAGIIWSASADAITVSPAGLVTAVANGKATIFASLDVAADSLELEVSQVVATVAVTPVGPLTLTSVGATESLTAVAKDAGGTDIAEVMFMWASDNEDAATVSTGGTVTAVADGVANITASASSVTSNAVAVTVTP